MKRVKWFIVPGLLIAIALFSFSFFQQQLQTLHSDPTPLQTQEEIEKTWNRPAPQPPLVTNTLIVFVTGTSPRDSLTDSWWKEINPEANQGVFTHANTNDETYLLFQLLSGQKESLNNTHTPHGYQNTDHLLHLAKYYKINTSVFSSQPVFPLADTMTFADVMKPAGLPIGSNQLTLLHIHTERDQITLQQISQYIHDFEERSQKDQLSSQVLLCLIPDQKTDGVSWIRNTTTRSPFLYWNTLSVDDTPMKSLSAPIEKPIEDLTATIAFSLGVVPPTGCLGKPVFDWYPIPEDKTMERFVYHIDQVIFSSVYYLNQYQLDDAIIAGYLLEADDTIHATDSANVVELERRYQVILDDFNSYHLYRQKTINVIPSLIFTLLALFSLLLWLYNWLTRYRPYTFGVLFFIAYVLLVQYGFPARVSLPTLASLSLWGMVLSQLLFVLPILTVFVLAFTLIAGYWFDISFEEICLDLNGMMISFAVCLLLFSATWVNRFGLIPLSMMPPFGVQLNQFHHLSLWILMPALLGFSYGLSYGLIRLLMALGPSHRKNS